MTAKPPTTQDRPFRRMVANFMLERIIAQRSLEASTSKRDLDKECGYPPDGEITIDMLATMYRRNSIAKHAIDFLPQEAWSLPPEFRENDDQARSTDAEVRWDELVLEHNLWSYIERADIRSRIASFGIMLLGFSDGGGLDKPLPGVPETAALNVIKGRV